MHKLHVVNFDESKNENTSTVRVEINENVAIKHICGDNTLITQHAGSSKLEKNEVTARKKKLAKDVSNNTKKVAKDVLKRYDCNDSNILVQFPVKATNNLKINISAHDEIQSENKKKFNALTNQSSLEDTKKQSKPNDDNMCCKCNNQKRKLKVREEKSTKKQLSCNDDNILCCECNDKQTYLETKEKITKPVIPRLSCGDNNYTCCKCNDKEIKNKIRDKNKDKKNMTTDAKTGNRKSQTSPSAKRSSSFFNLNSKSEIFGNSSTEKSAKKFMRKNSLSFHDLKKNISTLKSNRRKKDKSTYVKRQKKFDKIKDDIKIFCKCDNSKFSRRTRAKDEDAGKRPSREYIDNVQTSQSQKALQCVRRSEHNPVKIIKSLQNVSLKSSASDAKSLHCCVLGFPKHLSKDKNKKIKSRLRKTKKVSVDSSILFRPIKKCDRCTSYLPCGVTKDTGMCTMNTENKESIPFKKNYTNAHAQVCTLNCPENNEKEKNTNLKKETIEINNKLLIIAKYILIASVIFVWLPCLVVALLFWLIMYPCRPHNVGSPIASEIKNLISSPVTLLKPFSDANDNETDMRTKYNKSPIQTSSLMAAITRWVKIVSSKAVSSFYKFRSMILTESKEESPSTNCCYPSYTKNHPDCKKQYTLYFNNRRGWLMKPVKNQVWRTKVDCTCRTLEVVNAENKHKSVTVGSNNKPSAVKQNRSTSIKPMKSESNIHKFCDKRCMKTDTAKKTSFNKFRNLSIKKRDFKIKSGPQTRGINVKAGPKKSSFDYEPKYHKPHIPLLKKQKEMRVFKPRSVSRNQYNDTGNKRKFEHSHHISPFKSFCNCLKRIDDAFENMCGIYSDYNEPEVPCKDLYIHVLTRRPCFWVYKCAPRFYPCFLNLYSCFEQTMQLVLLLMVYCLWTPIWCCFYFVIRMMCNCV